MGRDKMKSFVSQQDIIEMAMIPVIKHADGKILFFAGATGYLMRMMIYALFYYKDHYGIGVKKIVALARNRKKAEEVFWNYRDRNDFELVHQDVNDKIEYHNTLDYIIHGASLVNPSDYIAQPVETIKSNSIGTFQLLEMARKTRCKNFLYISTSSVYGNMDEQFCQEEQCGILDFGNYKNSYSEGKRMGEAICNAYWHEYGLATKIVRPFYVFGSGMPLDDGRLFSDFILKALRDKEIVLKSDGMNKRNFIYITDAVRDIFFCMFQGKNGEAYNIGNRDGTFTILEFAKLVLDSSGSPGKVMIRHEESKIPSNIIDVIPCLDKIEKIVGKETKYIGVREGLERLIASVESRG